MKRILVMGAAGQIGSELVPALRAVYGNDNVVAVDIRDVSAMPDSLRGGPCESVDIMDVPATVATIKKYGIDSVYNLVALLSSVGESKPQLSWEVNLGGLMNLLEISREHGLALFTPSSIGAFGPSTPKKDTPQDTIQRPTSIYGVTKVAGELLADYYHQRFGVDARGVRFPGIISNVTLPGGGTTDYAVQIYYDAIKKGSFVSNIGAGTYMDMMYMPDATRAAIEVMEADPDKLIHRNCFNVAAMSFDPEEIATSVKKVLPDFTMGYDVDKVRQAIANSWPDNMDDSAAREEWGWKHEYDLERMTADMLSVLKKRYQ